MYSTGKSPRKGAVPNLLDEVTLSLCVAVYIIILPHIIMVVVYLLHACPVVSLVSLVNGQHGAFLGLPTVNEIVHQRHVLWACGVTTSLAF
jgi:hypothetical protein